MTAGISLRPLLATRADAERFVGRHDALSRLLAGIHAGVNTLVLADRGAGLTSFLNRAIVDLERLDDVDAVVLSGEVARGADDLLAAVGDRIGVGTGRRAARATAADRPEPATESGAGLLWRLERIRRAGPALPPGVEVARGGRRLVVVIDGIGSPAVAHTVFGQLRNELWQMQSISWVLGGAVAHRGHYLEPPADAFWESVIELPALPETDLEAILAQRELDELSDDVRTAVIQAAQGSPMKLLLAARTVQEGRLPDRPGPDRPRLSESASRLVHYLQTAGPASASDRGLLSQLGWSRGRAQQVLRALEEAGLVSAELAPANGGPGRPRKVYRLIETPP